MTQSGLRWVGGREIQKSLERPVRRQIEHDIARYGVGRGFRVRDKWIETPGDGLIIFQGMQNHTAESIKSLEGYDGAWCEEAQSLSQRSLDLLRPTIRKPGSELWFSWNPNKATDPVDAMLRGKGAPPGAAVVEANYRDNPWFPDVLREEMEWDRRRDPDKYAHIWGGTYQRNSEARVFKNWREDVLAVPDGVRPHFGADWGFAVDPTVLVRCWHWDRTLYIDAEAYKVGCEIDYTPALFGGTDKQTPARWQNPFGWSGVEGATEWPITADGARPETISYMQARGFRITAARKGAGSVEDGVEWLKSVDIVVHPRCRHTIDELTLFSLKVDKNTDEVLPVLADNNNHVIDAVRYAMESTWRKKTVMDAL